MSEARGRVVRCLDEAVAAFEPRQKPFQVGRTVIALGQLSVVLFSSRAHLAPMTAAGESFTCDGLAQGGIYCVLSEGPATAIVVAVLILVCCGLAPRALGLMHVWVSFSIAHGIGLPDGGEHVAQVVTLLVAVILLADSRMMAWRSPRGPGTPFLTGLALAAWWILRLQMSGIYLHSAVAKFGVENWLNGSAMYYIVRDPSFGASGGVATLMHGATNISLGVAVMTWGSIAVEIAIAVLLLLGARARLAGLGLAVILHALIILTIGLWSFGLVMIGAVVIAAAPSFGMGFRAAPRSDGTSDAVSSDAVGAELVEGITSRPSGGGAGIVDSCAGGGRDLAVGDEDLAGPGTGVGSFGGTSHDPRMSGH